MRKKTSIFWLLAAVVLIPSGGMAQQPGRWEATLEGAQRLAGQTNRLVLIQFWAPWCINCKRMEAETLVEPSVVAELSADYVAVKINADQFKATARQYGITGLPTTVITTPQGQVLDAIQGRAEAVAYAARLKRLAADAKPRDGAVYAQMPAAGPPPAMVRPAPAEAPTAPARQPIAAGPQPSNMGGPPLGSNAPAPTNFPPPVQTAMVPRQPPANALLGTGNPGLPPPGEIPPAQPATINPPLGLDGYCPVTLGEKQQWVVGDRRWGAIHRGRTYLFAGPEEQRRFLAAPAAPDRYAPVNSGNDIVLAAEQGQTVSGMREHGLFFGNRVYLFSSEATLEKFSGNPNLYANQAMGAVQAGAYAGQSVR
jgi:thiol-disulfide isomerase/thioredoxin/YHS domain-containing protein